MRKKKALAGVLASTLVLGNLTLPENISFGGLNFGTLFAQAAEVVDSGTLGIAGLTWTLDDTGVLTITGDGSMGIYWSATYGVPWYSERESITSVVIEDGVTDIGNYIFSDCINLKNVDIPDSVTKIGQYSFDNCSSLTYIKIPESV